MAERKTPSTDVERLVLVASRRRCCICYGLHGDLAIKQGQIAHLNRDPSDSSAENLAFLCLDHHDWFDTRTSQSKGATTGEAKHYREKLYNELKRRDQAEGGAAPAEGLAAPAEARAAPAEARAAPVLPPPQPDLPPPQPQVGDLEDSEKRMMIILYDGYPGSVALRQLAGMLGHSYGRAERLAQKLERLQLLEVVKNPYHGTQIVLTERGRDLCIERGIAPR